jgi:hypothetical protein
MCTVQPPGNGGQWAEAQPASPEQQAQGSRGVQTDSAASHPPTQPIGMYLQSEQMRTQGSGRAGLWSDSVFLAVLAASLASRGPLCAHHDADPRTWDWHSGQKMITERQWRRCAAPDRWRAHAAGPWKLEPLQPPATVTASCDLGTVANAAFVAVRAPCYSNGCASPEALQL